MFTTEKARHKMARAYPTPIRAEVADFRRAVTHGLPSKEKGPSRVIG